MLFFQKAGMFEDSGAIVVQDVETTTNVRLPLCMFPLGMHSLDSLGNLNVDICELPK